jgi:hypothetical protein
MANPWLQFKNLLPDSPLIIGVVAAHNGDGSSTILLPSNGIITAIGQTVAVGHKAFVRNGQVLYEAPDLPSSTLEI